eukprot:210447-Chlamydomonas_euryale.AAC.2
MQGLGFRVARFLRLQGQGHAGFGVQGCRVFELARSRPRRVWGSGLRCLGVLETRDAPLANSTINPISNPKPCHYLHQQSKPYHKPPSAT